jgi:hypothetical protein
MRERNVTRRDIGHALSVATSATLEGECWRFDGGTDLEGEALSVVVVLVGDAFVVTVF